METMKTMKTIMKIELTNKKTKTNTKTILKAVMTLEQVMEKRRHRMQDYCKRSG